MKYKKTYYDFTQSYLAILMCLLYVCKNITRFLLIESTNSIGKLKIGETFSVSTDDNDKEGKAKPVDEVKLVKMTRNSRFMIQLSAIKQIDGIQMVNE